MPGREDACFQTLKHKITGRPLSSITDYNVFHTGVCHVAPHPRGGSQRATVKGQLEDCFGPTYVRERLIFASFLNQDARV